MSVEVVDDQQSVTADANNKDLVLISESVKSKWIGNKFNLQPLVDGNPINARAEDQLMPNSDNCPNGWTGSRRHHVTNLRL